MKTSTLMRLFVLLFCVAAWSVTAQPAPFPPRVPLPVPSAPIEYFRQLLAMTPAAREQSLAARSPASRATLEAKLAEYEKLAPEERETRLRATELRWHLTRLMKTPATDRGPAATFVPESFRKVVETRLRQWDQFPDATRRQILTNEAALTFFTRLENTAPVRTNVPLAIYPPGMRQKMESDLGSFQKYFDLNEKQKGKTLHALSEIERAQMVKTLEAFEKLPKARRDLCLKGFQQFAELSPEERAQFLKNAEQWQTMSAEDRQAWRQLVAQLGATANRPPLPPGFYGPPRATLVATNF